MYLRQPAQTFVVVLTCILFAVAGCDNSGRVTSQQSFLMDHDAFALDSVVTLIESDRILDPDALETTINNPASGVVNVDIDKDGQVDYVQVHEVNWHGGKKFNFRAVPSGHPDGEPVIIATVTLRQGLNDNYTVEAGYPDYVRGYDSVFYTHTYRPTFGFTVWAFRPARVVYMPRPYADYHYMPRPLVPVVAFHETRRTYVTSVRGTTVSPIRAQARPRSFEAPTARELPSRYKTPVASPKSDRVSDRGGAMKDYGARNPDRPKLDGSNLGGPRQGSSPAPAARPASRPAPSPAPAARPASPTSRPRTTIKR